MANQPTKYRKFIVGAASAALVASAVAPVASAKDFSDTKGNTHEAAIDALSDAGVISGYPDGTFQPNKTLTRSDVVKLMGKWLESEGYEVASDYKTNPRFADLTSASNEELLKYAALVKDNGLFVGTPDGKLDPTGNITRENMAIVLVRAFDRVHDIDLVTYVAGQDFKKDVNDRATAKAEARPAIDVLDFFDITNPAAPAFNPKDTTTRGHFATFLHKSINTDFSDVTSGVVGSADVKAVNATTVEVTFKDAVENVNSLNFTIEGLTVSNAAVKQSDNKTVVLTTAIQEGGKEYTVSLNNKEIGKFKGVSAVIPTKIDITTQSVQGKVGQQAIVSADVGVKQAGIPVTFNVKANTIGTLNKDQVFEAVTNDEGIATFSYTQYAAGTDEVTAYPTGAPSVRSLGYVFWGVDTILDIEEVTKGDAINNGANKTYKVKYLDPKTGKPVAGKRFVVSFVENIDVNVNQLANAKVNNVQPSQLLNGTAPEGAVIITDGKGEATFTVTGENTEVTPVVFEQPVVTNTANNTVYTKQYSRNLLQSTASKVTFGAVQADYTIEMTREGLEEAARFKENGREYTIVVKDKDGNVAKNETVNVAFNEDLDGVISTQTAAQFIKYDANDNPYYAGKTTTVVTNSKGEASFVIGSDNLNDYATPIAWIDINSAFAEEGKLDKGEASTVGEISYFANAKLAGASLATYNEAGKKTTNIDASEAAEFRVALTNQSGTPIKLADVGYSHIEASFTVYNTGANVIEVDGQKVSPNRSHTVSANRGTTTDSILVTSVDGKAASVRVVANGVAKSGTSAVLDYNFTSTESTATFTPAKAVPALYTGVVESYNTDNQTLTFENKDAVKYTGTGFKYFGGNGAQLANATAFITEMTKGGTAVVTRSVDADGVATFSIVSISASGAKPVDTAKNEDAIAKAKEALNTAVKDAEAVLAKVETGVEPGQYPEAAVSKYDAAIKAAAAVAAKSDATEAELKAAAVVLDAATKEFAAAKNPEGVVDGITITTATSVGSTLSPLFLDFDYSIAGTVANADVKEVVLTFTGESGTDTKTVTVNDDKSFSIEIDGAKETFGDFVKVEVSYTVDGKEVKEEKEITRSARK